MAAINVIGSGAWGIVIAMLLDGRGHAVRLVCPREATATELATTREREHLLPGVRISDSIAIAADLTEADHWIVAVPTAYLRKALERFRGKSPKRGVISLTKGLENGTFRRPTEILREIVPGVPLAVLSGPSHAEEVARGLPTSVVVASDDLAYAQEVQRAVGTERFRVYASNDAVGVELAGAVKNVLAIAAGVGDGLGYGDNAKAALLSRGLVEMTRFGVALGAEPATFHGLAGMGDLTATCFSPHGRNRRFGERVARGEQVAKLLAGPQVVEGYFTAKSLFEKSIATGLEMPIVRSVYELLYEGKSAAQAVRDLMARAAHGAPFMTCGVAFKEWAAICAAIAAGAQSIILRKGGIAETGGEFTPEHSQFWLYPTYYHEDRSASLKPEAKQFLEAKRRPDTVALQTLVTVKRVVRIATHDEALALDSQHYWTAKTIEERFHYRTPGLYCLHIEAKTRGVPHILQESPAYAGCKTWVMLDESLSTGES